MQNEQFNSRFGQRLWEVCLPEAQKGDGGRPLFHFCPECLWKTRSAHAKMRQEQRPEQLCVFIREQGDRLNCLLSRGTAIVALLVYLAAMADRAWLQLRTTISGAFRGRALFGSTCHPHARC